MRTAFSLVLAVICILLVGITEVYGSTPAVELRRRSRAGDQLAQKLYKAVRFGESTQWFMWFLVVVVSTAFLLLVGKTTPLWFALTTTAALIWIGFIWIPRSGDKVLNSYLASKVAPVVAYFVRYTDRVTSRFTRKSKWANKHTKIYEKADLFALFDQQEKQVDNRVRSVELDMLRHMTAFNDQFVVNVMAPRRKVKALSVHDTLGPVVLDELHKSGHNSFPVYEGKADEIVGVIDLASAAFRKDSPKASELMSTQLFYIHEDQPLTDALKAVVKTNAQLFIVVNDFSEYVGVLSTRQVLRELVGEVIADEFNDYSNKEAVIEYLGKKGVETVETEAPKPAHKVK